MIRCAVAERYFAVGMDFPSARVFDVATGALAAVVEVPPRSRASLAVVSLKSLALGIVKEQQSLKKKKRTSVVDGLGACYAAVGLSNGTLLLKNVGKDEPVQHLALSETHQEITAMAFCGRYVFCLASNRSLYVVDCLRGECVASHLRVQHDAGAIAVLENVDAHGVNNNCDTAVSVFRVFVSGPTNAVYTLCLGAEAAEKSAVTLERLISFASQASRSDFAWMGGTMRRPVVVTANAQEGVVRVWDACPNVDVQTTSSRCRRTLLCGQRVVNISVHDTTSAGNNSADEVFVVATTFTGAVLVWNLGHSLLTSTAEPMPMPPTFHILSKETSGRLLFGAFVRGSSSNDPSLLVLRGRFALPQFEIVGVREAQSKATKTSPMIATAAATAMGEDVAVYTMSTTRRVADDRATDALHADMEVLDHAWAAHSRQQQRKRHVLAARAMQTPSEGFVPAVSFHAKSVKDIPQKSLTLEQRLKQLSISSSQQKHEENVTAAKEQQHVLGLATVPLYQALHANDASAVMELLAVASRSADDIRATVMGLQLPYCLQLLQLLAQRVRGGNSRSVLFEWIDAIIHYRGVEMYQVQQEFRQQKEKTAEERRNNGAVGDLSATSASPSSSSSSAATPSAPKDFVAPLLHQYRNMVALYDSVAAMYGRISIFKSVRPSKQGAFENSHAGVIFPKMFAEVRCAGGNYRTIKVHTKRDPRQQKSKKDGALALLREARRVAAAEGADDVNAGGVDGDEEDDELDMDALDKMRLSDDDDDAQADGEGVEMIADDDRGSSYGVESSAATDEAEFSPASDDDDDSLAAGEEDEEDDDTSSGSSDGVDDTLDEDDDEEFGDDFDDIDEEEDDDDDGMGDDMAELLRAQGEEEQLELRRHKRAKADR